MLPKRIELKKRALPLFQKLGGVAASEYIHFLSKINVMLMINVI